MIALSPLSLMSCRREQTLDWAAVQLDWPTLSNTEVFSGHFRTHKYFSEHFQTHKYFSKHFRTHKYFSEHFRTHKYFSEHFRTHKYISERYLIFVTFFTLTLFYIRKFYTQKCVNLRQKSPRDKTA